jgi:hypothetical protein
MDLLSPVQPRRRRATRVLLGGAILVIIAALCAGGLFVASRWSAASDNSRIRSQVTTYFNLQFQLWDIPSAETPGNISAATVSELSKRANGLADVETGDLLISQRQAVTTYSSALRAGDPIGIYTSGALDSITFDAPALITGVSATISGNYTYRFDSYHMSKGAREPDGLRGTDSFTAQLKRQNGVWLVASVHTDQLDVEASY